LGHRDMGNHDDDSDEVDGAEAVTAATAAAARSKRVEALEPGGGDGVCTLGVVTWKETKMFVVVHSE
jgi:hypothetical protein